jgi:hypothetical protein
MLGMKAKEGPFFVPAFEISAKRERAEGVPGTCWNNFLFFDARDFFKRAFTGAL